LRTGRTPPAAAGPHWPSMKSWVSGYGVMLRTFAFVFGQ
jgi:hypothetical protein